MHHLNIKRTLLFIFRLSITGSLYPMQQAGKLAAQIAKNPTITRIIPGLAFGTGVGTACYLLIRHRGSMSQLATTGWRRLFGRNPQLLVAQQGEPSTSIEEVGAHIPQEAMTPSTTIHELPTNVLEEIAGYLPKEDVASVRLTCKDMARRFCSQDIVLKTECETEDKLPAIRTLSATYPRNGLNVRTRPALLEHLVPMKNVTTLRLICQHLADLPQEMVQFKNLTGLNLGACDLQNNAILQIIVLCPRLKKLDLSCTNTKSIPAEIEKLNDLRELTLYGCSEFGWSVDIPLETSLKNICKIKNLITLGLGNINELNKLVPEFATLTKLKSLNLQGRRLLASDLIPLKDLKLEELNVNQLKINGNLGCIPQITSLQKLGLGNTNLSVENIEEIAQSLNNLAELNIENTKTSDLPPSFTRLTKLTSLDLHSNPLTPQALSIVCAMTNLRSLNIASCNLFELPEQMAGITNLRSLAMAHDNLNQKAIIVACTLLPCLKQLSCYHTGLTNLSPEILAACRNLQELSLYDNWFPEAEKQRIMKALPHTKLSF